MKLILLHFLLKEEDDISPTDSTNEETWVQKKDFDPARPPLVAVYYKDDTDVWDELQYFNQYINDSIFQEIADKTNQTSVLKNSKSINTSTSEIRKWFGISMIMACLQYPLIRMYWQKKWQVPVICNAMTRDRFFKLRSSLKIVFDNDISPEFRQKDRLWKVRPLLESVRQGCLKQPRATHIAVDEMIVPFEGRCALKQFVKGKPNPVGIKVFVLANPNGIVCDFIPYQGESTFKEEFKQYGLGTAAVLSLIESLHPGHVLYFDRYFTSPKLADELYKRDFRFTGTVMVNRLPKTLKFKSDKELNKKGVVLLIML